MFAKVHVVVGILTERFSDINNLLPETLKEKLDDGKLSYQGLDFRLIENYKFTPEHILGVDIWRYDDDNSMVQKFDHDKFYKGITEALQIATKAFKKWGVKGKVRVYSVMEGY